MRLRNPVWSALGLVVMLVLTGCGAMPELPNPFAAPTSTPTPTVTPTPTSQPASPPPAATPTPAVMQLVWWTPIWFAPSEDEPAGRFLAEQVAAFEAQHPNVRVQALPKRSQGKGSVRDYLEGAYKVAPSLLPDVVTVNMNDLPALSALGLFQPLDALLPAEATANLYPLARSAGVVDEQWLGVALVVDFYHLAYQRERLPSPPMSWDAVLNSEARYLPALFRSDTEVADPVLLQYMAAGGELPYAQPVPLNDQALLSVLNFYDQAWRRGIITATAVSLVQDDARWTALLNESVDFIDISAQRYARDGLQRAALDVAGLPTWDGKPRALAYGWGLAITTNDPERQKAAAAWIAWLLQPEVLGPWSQMVGRLPTHPQALAAWSAPGTYIQTVDTLLQNAQPYPTHPSLSALRRALALGLKSLLQEGATPEAALRRVLEAYTPQY